MATDEITGGIMSKQTSLYRHFDKEGNLLYVGISNNALNRLSQHKKAKWSELIAQITIQDYPDRESALMAESDAILKEHPRFNNQYNQVLKGIRRYAELQYKPERQMNKIITSVTGFDFMEFGTKKKIDELYEKIKLDFQQGRLV